MNGEKVDGKDREKEGIGLMGIGNRQKEDGHGITGIGNSAFSRMSTGQHVRLAA